MIHLILVSFFAVLATQQVVIYTSDPLLDIDLRLPSVRIKQVFARYSEDLYAAIDQGTNERIIIHGYASGSDPAYELLFDFINDIHPAIATTFVFESTGIELDWNENERKIIQTGLHINNEAHLAKYLGGRHSNLHDARTIAPNIVSFKDWQRGTFMEYLFLNLDSRFQVFVFSHAHDYITPARGLCTHSALMAKPFTFVLYANFSGWFSSFDRVVKGTTTGIGQVIADVDDCTAIIDDIDEMWASNASSKGLGGRRTGWLILASLSMSLTAFSFYQALH